jgi:hypothetical protein
VDGREAVAELSDGELEIELTVAAMQGRHRAARLGTLLNERARRPTRPRRARHVARPRHRDERARFRPRTESTSSRRPTCAASPRSDRFTTRSSFAKQMFRSRSLLTRVT